jgi:cell division protein FtsW (lipid II flippase)
VILAFDLLDYFFAGALLDFDFVRKHIMEIFFAFSVLLMLVLITRFGHSVNGLRRGISIAGVT